MTRWSWYGLNLALIAVILAFDLWLLGVVT